MTIVLSIAGAAALVVIAYEHIRSRSPRPAPAGLRAVRELAAVVLVCVRAVEGIADVLGGHQRVHVAPGRRVGPYGRYDPDYQDPDYEDLEEDEP